MRRIRFKESIRRAQMFRLARSLSAKSIYNNTDEERRTHRAYAAEIVNVCHQHTAYSQTPHSHARVFVYTLGAMFRHIHIYLQGTRAANRWLVCTSAKWNVIIGTLLLRCLALVHQFDAYKLIISCALYTRHVMQDARDAERLCVKDLCLQQIYYIRFIMIYNGHMEHQRWGNYSEQS